MNKIDFIIDNPTRLYSITNEMSFQSMQGTVDICIDDENVMLEKTTKRRVVDNDRIIEFASMWLSKTPELIDGNKIEVADNTNNFDYIFYKNGERIFFDLLDKQNNNLAITTKSFSEKKYYELFLDSINSLEKQMKINPFVRKFKIFNYFKTKKYEAASKIIDNKILSEGEVDGIFNHSLKDNSKYENIFLR